MRHDLQIAPPVALGVHVTDRLRREIVSGELPSGTHLVEGKLSELFGVSRGPVRDSLRQLEAEGLVESRRRGVYVRGLSLDDIDELYSLRTMLEREALQLAMHRESQDWTAVQRALGEMTEAADRGDVEAFAHADLDYHTAFYRAAGHRRLGDVWGQYKPTFSAMLSVTNAQDARDLHPTLSDHSGLLAALVAQDEPSVMALLAEHIEGSRQRMRRAHGQAIAVARPADRLGLLD
ncbi:GntR family transcriptional regulator [Microlunatus soli]|uniref:Transcriptional regulator, GntR family n=1 Tax=Microlunatus soli TaxID=630515 RepID=A0A1H1QT01_9ACTN|nr:GntR family transcriptional regulator [Microlunatus soli]SDS26443.1 transcriptional regulator, GntR family [Microlunatus soli]